MEVNVESLSCDFLRKYKKKVFFRNGIYRKITALGILSSPDLPEIVCPKIFNFSKEELHKRVQFAKITYFFFRTLDDLADRDFTIGGIRYIPSDSIFENLREVNKERRVLKKDTKKGLELYLASIHNHIEGLDLDPEAFSEYIELYLSTIEFDSKRFESRTIYPETKIEEYFRKNSRALSGILVDTFDGTSRDKEVVEETIYYFEKHNALKHYHADRKKGIINISTKDWNEYVLDKDDNIRLYIKREKNRINSQVNEIDTRKCTNVGVSFYDMYRKRIH